MKEAGNQDKQGAKPRVLILVEWFSPGFKAGGPIRSVANLVEGLRDHCDFAVITTNRDLGSELPYPGIPEGKWIETHPGLRVIYYAPERLSYRLLQQSLRSLDYDVLYLNGIFSLKFTLYPLWIARRMKRNPHVILAPRGMLAPSALSLKKRKKRLFLGLIRNLALHKRILFHATKDEEISNIQSTFGSKIPVHYAPNLPQMQQNPWKALPKEAGKLKMVCIARIHEIKNLLFLIQALQNPIFQSLGQEIELDFVGPYEQPSYWEKCEEEIQKLPTSIAVRRLEAVEPSQLPQLLAEYHFFALPTFGENFGHSIFEAMSAGKPVIISDKTPWQELEAKKAGWAISLEEPESYAKAISAAAAMDATEYALWSRSAWNFVADFLNDPDLIRTNIDLFSGGSHE